MRLLSPQFGIFALGTNSHYFLELDLRPGVTVDQAVVSFTGLRAPVVAAGGVNVVVAFRGELWRQAAPSHVPAHTEPFPGISTQDGGGAPSTPHDAWIWISGSSPDVAWEHARAAAHAVGDVCLVATEQPCFQYRDSRDLTGFIDGTQNPPLRRAADIAIVPSGQPGEGGSHVIVMRWVHDLDRFYQLPVPEQERVFGRSKVDSIEMQESEKPLDAHIARVSVERDGEELEIFRRSVPYGSMTESGLYFVGFSADPTRFDAMLARMFGTSEDGRRDRLTDFSHPVGGAYYFAPSQNALNEFGEI